MGQLSRKGASKLLTPFLLEHLLSAENTSKPIFPPFHEPLPLLASTGEVRSLVHSAAHTTHAAHAARHSAASHAACIFFRLFCDQRFGRQHQAGD